MGKIVIIGLDIEMYVEVKVKKGGWYSYKLMEKEFVWENSHMMNLNKLENLLKR